MSAHPSRRAMIAAPAAIVAASALSLPASAGGTVPQDDAAMRLWAQRMSTYRDLVAVAETVPENHPSEDAAWEASVRAMDRLINETPAPSIGAMLIKLDLARTRGDGGLFDDHADAIRADLVRLSQEGR